MRAALRPIGLHCALALGLALLGAPVASRGQTARVAGGAERGGIVVGRVCLDLDGSGGCDPGEPGISGARVRFEDGRSAVTDPAGRFHAVDVAARILLPDRSAWGAHAVSVDGLGVTRSFELAPGGAASVELPVVLAASDGVAGSVEPLLRAVPALAPGAVEWPIAGSASPGAVVRAGEREAVAGPDGKWSLKLPLADGRNVVAVSIRDGAGRLALWGQVLHVARPSSGALRVYPSPPLLLASLTVRESGEGVVVAGRASPGVTLRVGGQELQPDGEGRFGAFAVAGQDGRDGVDGRVELSATREGVAVSHALSLAPRIGRFEGVLLGELELQGGGEAGLLFTGRLAGSASAAWRGFDFEAGLDLDDRDRSGSALASPRSALVSALTLDPLLTFASPGDGAAVEDRNPGRGRLWASVVGHGLRLGLGSGRTGLDAGELARHDRAFFGARVEGERQVGPVALRAVAFGGQTATDARGLVAGVPRHDRFAATGGSLFYLRARAIAAGSEVVRVEWRDPWTGLPVGGRELIGGRDYALDATSGRLLLARPLPTVAAPATIRSAEPFAAAEAWLCVDYLTAEVSDEDRGLAGAEAAAAVGPVRLSVSGATETRAGQDWGVVAGGAALDLGELLRTRVEVAHSEGRFYGAAGDGFATSLDGGFSFAAPALPGGGATALHLSAEGRAGPASFAGWWRERPRGFSDGRLAEPVDARERGALAQGAIGPAALRLEWAERTGADPRDPTGATQLDSARAHGSATWGVGPVELTVDALHERLRRPVSGEQSAVGAHAAWRTSRALTLEASHLQAVDLAGEAVDATFTAAGGSIRHGPATLGLRAGWGPELGPRLVATGGWGDAEESLYGTLSVDPAGAGVGEAQGSVVGGRQRVRGGTLFTEERVARDPLGLRVGRVAGATLDVARGLKLSLSGERGERLRLDGSTVARGAGGVAASWAAGAVRVDGRAELRSEGSGEQWVGGGGLQWEATRRLTLAAGALLADGELSGRAARTLEGWLSAAWRSDPVSVLARVARVEDHRDGIADRDATLGALAVTARAWRRLRVGVGLDAADQRISGADDDRLAASARLGVQVAGPADVAVEYARRGSLDGRALGDLDAVRAEAGFTFGAIRLALGYALAGFRGTGLEPEEDDGRFYLRAVAVR